MRQLVDAWRLAAMVVAAHIAFWSAGSASAEPVRTGNAVAELVAERAAIAPGDTFLAALKLDIDEGWHVYWRNPGDSGLPAEIRWTDAADAEFGEFTWPIPHEQPLEGLMNYGYETQLVLPFDVRVPADLAPGDTLVLEGVASWLICEDICIPEDARLTLRLPVAEQPVANAEAGALISAALEASPTPITGEARVHDLGETLRVEVADRSLAETLGVANYVRIYPDGHEIEHPAAQPVKVGPAGASLELVKSNLAPAETTAFSGVVVVEGAGARQGFSFAAAAGEPLSDVAERSLGGGSALGEAGSAESLGFVGLLTFLGLAFVGGLILNLMPCVLPVLSIKASGLIHAAQEDEDGGALKRHGAAYLAGVVLSFLIMGAALLALRSAGEQAGLGFQLQYPPVVAFLALLVFLIGLNLLGVFEIGTSIQGAGGELAQKSGTTGAFFTGVLASIVGAPCIGPFLGAASAVVVSQPASIVLIVFAMIGVGLAAPFVAISFAPQVARFLPKPGRWMETLKEFFAFPMFLTAAWLIWVFAGQVGTDGAAVLVAAAALLAFGVWLMKTFSGAALARAAGFAVIIAAFAVSIMSSGGRNTAVAAVLDDAAVVEDSAWSPERVQALRAEGRPIFVDFTARWCVTCQLNKRAAIKTAPVAEAFAENDVAFLTADWTNKNDVIAAELAAHGRAGVPLYLIYPSDGGEPAILPQLLTPGLIVEAVEKAVQ